MKIGLFSDYYLASSDGTAIATEISRQALSDLGHKVLVFCPEVPNLAKKTYVKALPSMAGFFYPGLRLSWPFAANVLNSAKQLDLIHVETPLLIGLAGLRAAKKLGRPVVISAHLDMDFMGEYKVAPLALFGLGVLVAIICRQPRGLIRALIGGRRNPKVSRRVDFAWRIFAYFCDQADVCVAISKKIYDQLDLYKQKDNLTLVPNGLDLAVSKLPSKQAVRRQLGWKVDDFIVISLARLVREKEVDVIISAVKRLADEPRLKLFIFNDGPERRRLKKLVESLRLEDKVSFHSDLIPQKKLYRYIVAADVYVNASPHEVASLAALEAALCAKPLLLFDKRLAELLKDGVNGFFVSDGKQLAHKISWLMKHPDQLGKLGQASRRRVQERYSQAAHGRALAVLYEQLLKER